MEIYRSRFYIVLILALSVYCPGAYSQNDSVDRRIEYSTGAAMIIYQSGYAMENGAGIEVAAKGRIVSILGWQSGARVWFNPAAPEVFARIVLSDQFEAWTPVAGIEVGLTGRGKFGEGAQLLREARNAMLEDISPFYISGHIAPFSFTLKNSWRLSAAEINFGSHFENIGRTLRLHVTILSISKSF